MLCLCLNFFKFLYLKYLTKFEIPNPIVVFCQSNIRGCKSCLQICPIEFFKFPSFEVFLNFFFNIFKTFGLKHLTKFEMLNLFVKLCKGTLRGWKSCLQI